MHPPLRALGPRKVYTDAIPKEASSSRFYHPALLNKLRTLRQELTPRDLPSFLPTRDSKQKYIFLLSTHSRIRSNCRMNRNEIIIIIIKTIFQKTKFRARYQYATIFPRVDPLRSVHLGSFHFQRHIPRATDSRNVSANYPIHDSRFHTRYGRSGRRQLDITSWLAEIMRRDGKGGRRRNVGRAMEKRAYSRVKGQFAKRISRTQHLDRHEMK